MQKKAALEEKQADSAGADDPKGVPEFWLTIFKRVDMLEEMLQVALLLLYIFIKCKKKVYIAVKLTFWTCFSKHPVFRFGVIFYVFQFLLLLFFLLLNLIMVERCENIG